MATIGAIIRAGRLRLRMSEQQFGDALGVTRGAVQQWESGKTAPRRKLQSAVARLIGISLADLVAPPPDLQDADIDTWLAARQQRKDDADVIDAQVREARENAAPYRLPSARSVDALDAVRSDVQSLPPELREVLAQLVSEYLTADDDRKDVLRVAIERLKGGKYQSDTSGA